MLNRSCINFLTKPEESIYNTRALNLILCGYCWSVILLSCVAVPHTYKRCSITHTVCMYMWMCVNIPLQLSVMCGGRERGRKEGRLNGWLLSCWRFLWTGTATRLKSHIEALRTQLWIWERVEWNLWTRDTVETSKLRPLIRGIPYSENTLVYYSTGQNRLRDGLRSEVGPRKSVDRLLV